MTPTAPPRLRLANARDAGPIVELIRSCYGETYPELTELTAPRLRQRMRARDLVYAVAEGPDGALLGQIALERRGAKVYEHGRAIVAEGQRAQGWMGRLGTLLVEGWARGAGVKMLTGRSVTCHLASQRYCQAVGMQPLGLLLGLWDPSLRVAGLPPASQPISAVLVGMCLDEDPAPRRLALEGHDLARAAATLDRLGIPVSSEAPPAAPRLGVRTAALNGRVGWLRFESGAAEGEGWAAEVGAAFPVRWADVPSCHPEAAEVVSRLRRLGYGYAAYVPWGGPGGEDVLRLQRYDDPRPLDRDAIEVLDVHRELRDDLFAEAALATALSP